MTDAPEVSIVMPVYREEAYLEKAVASVLGQTLGRFELIAVADDPTAAAREILDRYASADARVKVLYQARQGLVRSLNTGCHAARGRYIARMDADDVSMPDRLEKQVAFLDSHPEIGVLGTWARYIDEEGRTLMINRTPPSPYVAGWLLYLGNVLTHTSVMMRRDLVENLGYYSEDAPYAEDYDLWSRAVGVTGVASLPEALVCYRSHGDSVSALNLPQQETTVTGIMGRSIRGLLNEDVPAEAVADLRCLIAGRSPGSIGRIDRACALMMRMQDAYIESRQLPPEARKQVTRSTGSKLYLFALAMSKLSLIRGAAYFARALRLNPTLPRERLKMAIEPRLGNS